MSDREIKTSYDVHRFIEQVQRELVGNGLSHIAKQFDDALSMGSSGLEILGTIQTVLVENRRVVEQILGPSEKHKVESVIAFVEKAFGR